jgi:hypothetical protein
LNMELIPGCNGSSRKLDQAHEHDLKCSVVSAIHKQMQTDCTATLQSFKLPTIVRGKKYWQGG